MSSTPDHDPRETPPGAPPGAPPSAPAPDEVPTRRTKRPVKPAPIVPDAEEFPDRSHLPVLEPPRRAVPPLEAG